MSADGREPAVWYLAVCAQCTPVLPMPFFGEAERDEWAQAHGSGTGHAVGIFQHTGVPRPFDPDWTMAPAALLRVWMDEHKISPDRLARRCAKDGGLTTGSHNRPAALARIRYVLGRQPLTEEIAVMLERGTGVKAQFWRNAEANYRHGLAKGRKDVTS